MPNFPSIVALLASIVLPSVSFSHEFWIRPDRFAVAQGGAASLTLNVGEYFVGERLPFTTPYVAALWRHAGANKENLLPRVPKRGEAPSFEFAVPTAGTHLIAFDSHPNQVELSADKFDAYLHEEGLEAIRERREEAGTASQPGRERYRRHVKTLIHAGKQSDRTHARRTGQRLEIVPLNNPFDMRPGDALKLAIYFDDWPLPGVLVKAWHKRSHQTVIVRARSSRQGLLSFDLPYAGPWMISVVHMIEAVDAPDIDWDSFWGNLTFELPAGPAAP